MKRKRDEPLFEKRVSQPTEKMRDHIVQKEKRLGDLSPEEILLQKEMYLQSSLPLPKEEVEPLSLSYTNSHNSEIDVDDDLISEINAFLEDEEDEVLMRHAPNSSSSSSSSSHQLSSISSSSCSSTTSSSMSLPLASTSSSSNRASKRPLFK